MAKRILIDRGHGGSDPGAVSYVREVDITHSWGNELANTIKSLGGDVYVLQDGWDANSDLSVPVNEANAYGNPWLFISIHANAGGGTGYETYLYTGAWNNKATSDLGHAIHNTYGEVARKYGLANRNLKPADFYVLRNTRNEAALLELGFVDRKFDADLLANAAFRKEACNALARGLMRVAGQAIKEPEPQPLPVPDYVIPFPDESKRLNLADGTYHIYFECNGVTLDNSLSKSVAQGWQANGQEQQYPRWEQKTKRWINRKGGKDFALDGVYRKDGVQALWWGTPHLGALEQWFIELIGYTNKGLPRVRLRNAYSGRCIAIKGGSAVNGTSVIMEPPGSSPYQYLILEKIGN